MRRLLQRAGDIQFGLKHTPDDAGLNKKDSAVLLMQCAFDIARHLKCGGDRRGIRLNGHISSRGTGQASNLPLSAYYAEFIEKAK